MNEYHIYLGLLKPLKMHMVNFTGNILKPTYDLLFMHRKICISF